MKKKMLALISAVLVLSVLATVCYAEKGQSDQDNLYWLTIDVDKYDYDAANDLLSRMNEVRQSGNAWYYKSDGTVKELGVLDSLIVDESLTQAAMYRAAQCAVRTAHELPSGEGYVNNGVHEDVWMENIAYGQKTSSQAFTSLMEEKRGYSGQDHRRSILSSSAKYVGVGCATVEGITYWVVEYASEEPSHEANAIMTDNSATILVNNNIVGESEDEILGNKYYKIN